MGLELLKRDKMSELPRTADTRTTSPGLAKGIISYRNLFKGFGGFPTPDQVLLPWGILSK
jgi:hypothetical protein